MRPTTLMLAMCFALLAGCAVGPDYKLPKASAPTQWTSSLAGGETNGPADLAAWWKNFNDTNLDSLMTTAVQSNLTLRIAESGSKGLFLRNRRRSPRLEEPGSAR